MDVTALHRALVAVPAPVRAERRAESPEAQAAAGPDRHGVRPEIQALRAIAVALVVVYHLWPARAARRLRRRRRVLRDLGLPDHRRCCCARSTAPAASSLRALLGAPRAAHPARGAA